MEELLSACEKSIEAINGEQFLLDGRTAELTKTVAAENSAIAGVESQKAAADAEIAELSGGRDSVTEQREKLSGEITDLRILIMQTEKEIDAQKESIELLNSAVQGSADRGDSLNSQIEAIKELSGKERAEIERINGEIAKKREEISAVAAGINELMNERDDAERSGQQLRQKERDMTAERERLGGEVARLEERRENMLREYDDIVRRLFDEYELTRTEAEQVAKPVENIGEAKRELSDIKGKIKSLGNVNVSAIDEYKEVKERYDFMKSQMDDIETSRKELSALIGDLTGQMKEKFTEGFSSISTNFTKVFTELFGGGSAKLVLTDPENVLESGIDIEVKLPGKNVPSIDGMSGGEKALIAISIYFAIMMVNAPPFCFLDEVDTALDDINVERFANYMARSQFATQFICVTHRRGTMEAADMLYGVTMQEKGVTKLLQLDVDELIKTLNINENK